MEGTLYAKLEGHKGPVYDVATCIDDVMASASHDEDSPIPTRARITPTLTPTIWEDLILWDIEDITGSNKPQALGTLKGHTGAVRACCFNQSGTRLASASYDKTCRIWDTKEKKELLVLKGHTRSLRIAAYHPTEEIVATGGDDSLVKIWNAKNGSLLQSMSDHESTVFGLHFSPDGSALCSGSYDDSCIRYDWKTGKTLYRLKDDYTKQVYSVNHSSDSKYIVLCSVRGDYNITTLWDVKTEKCVARMVGHDKQVYSCTFHPTKGYVVSSSLDKTLKVWDLKVALAEGLMGDEGHELDIQVLEKLQIEAETNFASVVEEEEKNKEEKNEEEKNEIRIEKEKMTKLKKIEEERMLVIEKEYKQKLIVVEEEKIKIEKEYHEYKHKLTVIEQENIKIVSIHQEEIRVLRTQLEESRKITSNTASDTEKELQARLSSLTENEAALERKEREVEELLQSASTSDEKRYETVSKEKEAELRKMEKELEERATSLKEKEEAMVHLSIQAEEAEKKAKEEAQDRQEACS